MLSLRGTGWSDEFSRGVLARDAVVQPARLRLAFYLSDGGSAAPRAGAL